MNIGPVIYSVLSADATVSGLVGTKIYPLWARQNEPLPQVVYGIDAIRPTEHKGLGSASDTIQVYCTVHARLWDDLITLCTAIREALDGYTGTVSGITVKYCVFKEMTTTREEEAEVARAEMIFNLRLT